MKTDLPVIFVISNEPWGDQWFVKHHFANELAKMDFEVYFIDPVEPWTPSNLLSANLKIVDISPQLKLVNYQNPFPVRVFPTLIQRFNDRLISKKLEKLRLGKRLIVWQFDAFRFTFNFFKKSKKIYHIADHYHDLPFDKLNIRNSDLLICTGSSMMSYYSEFKKPIMHVPHGISNDEFEVNEKHVAKLNTQFGDFILHAGTINDRLDISILLTVLDKFPATNTVLIGPNKLSDSANIRLFEQCLSRPNLHFLGAVNGKLVKDYVRASRVCLILYSFDSVQTVGTVSSSLKVLNYLAQKKPVVTSIQIEYPELQECALFHANNMDQYIKTLSRALNDELMIDKKVVDSYLLDKTYPKFIADVFKKLEE